MGINMGRISGSHIGKGFHSEVGLCGNSLRKLRLFRSQRTTTEPPAIIRTRKQRPVNNNMFGGLRKNKTRKTRRNKRV